MIVKHALIKSGHKSSFNNLLNYLLNDLGKHERLGEIKISNCHQSEPLDAALEIKATQNLNRRSKVAKTYHLIISFREGEKPSSKTLSQIENQICLDLGFKDHQRISVVHQDTNNLHVHVAINKIHPKNLISLTPYRDFKVLARSCEHLEESLGLERDNHQVHKRPRQKLEDVDSMIAWVKLHCAKALKQAKNWAEAHKILSRHGLQVQPKKNGLVLVNQTGLGVKASSIDKYLSKMHWQQKLGPLEEAVQPQPPAEKTYEQAKVVKSPKKELWPIFKLAQQKLRQSFKNAQINIEAKFRLERQHQLRKRVKVSEFLEKLLLPSSTRQALDHKLSKKVQQSLKKVRLDYRLQKKAAKKNFKEQSWSTWLKERLKLEPQEKYKKSMRKSNLKDKEQTNEQEIGQRKQRDIEPGNPAFEQESEGTRSLTLSNGKAGITAQPNFASLACPAPPAARNRLRDLRQLDVVRTRTGSEVLLQNDVPSQLDQSVSSAHKSMRWGLSGDQGLAMQAIHKYVAERMSKRARGIDVPIHRGAQLQDLLNQNFEYAGQRKVDEQQLILLKQGPDVLVVAMPDNWQKLIKKIKLGHEIKIGAKGQIQTRVNQL